ncbi:putative inorganic phosphate transporter 1-7 [Datura stramonium]|uniref:Inorganic phosphate transporter 1-7 n=1 Tax=Datura stramonium TaxID=4076 RepID=A0ABS8V6R3_DATST|nr:putative inorganic phosphate transporter 1-7 [Datura stramonium]
MAGDMKILNALASAKTQWYHFTAIIIAGMGFFTDAYDLFCISLVTKLLGRIYYHVDGSPKPGSLPPNVSAAANGVAFCGSLAGKIFFGWLGDKIGRKKVYGMTLMLMCLCYVASGLSFGREPKTVLATLCFFHFWLGFGIGSDYPLSATIMSEYAIKKIRGAFIAAVFSMQGFGILPGGIFVIIIYDAFQASFKKPPTYEVDALGSTVDIGTEQKEPAVSAVNSSNEFGFFTKQFVSRHGLHLLGTTITWFLLDIAYYSHNLFQKDIFSAVGWIPAAKTMSAIEEVYKIARAQTLISLCSTVLGYWFTMFLIDRIGRFTIQLLGFSMMTVFMFALVIPHDNWTHPGNHIGFVVLYSLAFFFANFGPNATIFVLPAEIFPARLRSTFHGISVACGKLGAMVGAFGFLYLA